ncbi:MOSC domain-containing protein [Marinimicrobium sp. LS-A18]|uniref:MOSC domain-containing protein n=1 Tax=Marinimicrobium sp. LS-A18 TaxID=1381596 RepID=UPI0004B92BF6|nr:MOSC domain-containing protein [Marinimicrobium sp. LS-A18]
MGTSEDSRTGDDVIDIGRVKAIWRYPIKGMAGEHVESVQLGPMGVPGDRVMAVQDVARQEIQSCKFRPQLLQCRAQTVNPQTLDGPIEIQFPDGSRLSATDPQTDRRLSALLGHESRLQRLRPASDEAFYRRYKADDHTWLEELKATFEREPGEPLPALDQLPEETQNYVSLRGSFFLVSPFHIVSTASLVHLAELNAQADWDIERFRPNLVIETPPGMTGLAEQAWLGKALRIGSARIECSEPAPRCGAVVRAQQGFGSDTSILRTIVREADQNLGIYGDVTDSGQITVGDRVFIDNGPIK